MLLYIWHDTSYRVPSEHQIMHDVHGTMNVAVEPLNRLFLPVVVQALDCGDIVIHDARRLEHQTAVAGPVELEALASCKGGDENISGVSLVVEIQDGPVALGRGGYVRDVGRSEAAATEHIVQES
jgi:hypothetical protein